MCGLLRFLFLGVLAFKLLVCLSSLYIISLLFGEWCPKGQGKAPSKIKLRSIMAVCGMRDYPVEAYCSISERIRMFPLLVVMPAAGGGV